MRWQVVQYYYCCRALHCSIWGYESEQSESATLLMRLVVRCPQIPGLGDQGGSLMKILQMDLMKRFLQLQQQRQPQSQERAGQRPQRPSRNWGAFPSQTVPQEPVDITRYIGPEADLDLTWETLQERGRVPGPESIPAPLPGSATAQRDRWESIPLKNRMDHAEGLLERRQYEAANEELETILEKELPEAEKIRALTLREKALFHLGHYDITERDYYRLKAYYPRSREVAELKQYLEEKANLAPLQQQVKATPEDPQVHRRLLDQYFYYSWLDFAEQFFAEEIQDTSVPTIRV